jgi:alpha-1,3-glucan synthase
MILLQSLTRIHISAALIGSPVLSSATTMLVHAAQSGDGNGPGTFFPSFAAGALPGLASPWFWVGFDITVVCLCGILCVL